MQYIKNNLYNWLFSYKCAECREIIDHPPPGKYYEGIGGQYFHKDCKELYHKKRLEHLNQMFSIYVDPPNKPIK